MNQRKLDMVKWEMIMNIDILGISELKWMEWVNLIQITTVGKTPKEEMEYLS